MKRLLRFCLCLLASSATTSLWAYDLDTNGDERIHLVWFTSDVDSAISVQDVQTTLTRLLTDAEHLPVTITHIPLKDSLVGWICSSKSEVLRDVDRYIVSPARRFDAKLLGEGLRALQSPALPPPLLVSTQEPAYSMRKIFDPKRAIAVAKLAQQTQCTFAPVDIIWKRVYTDDHYDADLKPGKGIQSYVYAATLLTVLTDGDEPGLYTAQTDLKLDAAERLSASIARGYAKDLYKIVGEAKVRIATRCPDDPSPTLTITLGEGAYERMIRADLIALAERDGRILSFTDTTTPDATGAHFVGCVTRDALALPEGKATLFYRPFSDATTDMTMDLDLLDAKLKLFPLRKGHVPYEMALRRIHAIAPNVLTDVDDTAEVPTFTQPLRTLLATLIYAELTGRVIVPEGPLSQALSIGVNTYLQLATNENVVNAITPAFTLTPTRTEIAFRFVNPLAEDVTISLSLVDEDGHEHFSRALDFDEGDAPAQQHICLTDIVKDARTPLTLYWATQTTSYAGIKLGSHTFVPQVPKTSSSASAKP